MGLGQICPKINGKMKAETCYNAWSKLLTGYLSGNSQYLSLAAEVKTGKRLPSGGQCRRGINCVDVLETQRRQQPPPRLPGAVGHLEVEQLPLLPVVVLQQFALPGGRRDSVNYEHIRSNYRSPQEWKAQSEH